MLLEPVVVLVTIGGARASSADTASIANSADREVVVAQLVERSFPIPEVRGSNPVIGKNLFFIEHLFTVNCVLKRRK